VANNPVDGLACTLQLLVGVFGLLVALAVLEVAIRRNFAEIVPPVPNSLRALHILCSRLWVIVNAGGCLIVVGSLQAILVSPIGYLGGADSRREGVAIGD
jgi:gamma-glutamyltranspeptidase